MKVIIIGGVAGGASCAARLRRLDEKAEIVMVERGRACRKVFSRPICNGIVPYRTYIDASKETPNKVDGGGGLATEAYLLTAACLEAVWVGANRGCSEVLLGRFRD